MKFAHMMHKFITLGAAEYVVTTHKEDTLQFGHQAHYQFGCLARIYRHTLAGDIILFTQVGCGNHRTGHRHTLLHQLALVGGVFLTTYQYHGDVGTYSIYILAEQIRAATHQRHGFGGSLFHYFHQHSGRGVDTLLARHTCQRQVEGRHGLVLGMHYRIQLALHTVAPVVLHRVRRHYEYVIAIFIDCHCTWRTHQQHKGAHCRCQYSSYLIWHKSIIVVSIEVFRHLKLTSTK